MKITMTEFDGCFSFDMVAETVEDAALLARFAVNRTTEALHVSSNAYQDGTFTGELVIGKAKNATTEIGKRK